MSNTIRNYEFNKGRDGVRRERYLKLTDQYTGYVGEETWNHVAKRQMKKHANKHNRQIENRFNDED